MDGAPQVRRGRVLETASRIGFGTKRPVSTAETACIRIQGRIHHCAGLRPCGATRAQGAGA